MGDFVRPDRVKLPLSGGRFIIVKRRLNVGEREDLLGIISAPNEATGKLAMKQGIVRVQRVLAYLLGWSLTDGDTPGEGLPVPMSPDMPDAERLSTIRSLDPDTFDEIFDAISAHEDAVDKATAAQKKILNGSKASSETSASQPALAGAMSG